MKRQTGGDVLAIAHNGNLANGIMFPVESQNDGKAVDISYVERRARWEPLYEVTQIKGDGETHPLLSPDDEFADYETWDIGNLDVSEAKTDAMIPGEYAREALKRGLLLEEELGNQPLQVRHDRLHGQPHLVSSCSGGQLLWQAFRCGARPGAYDASLHEQRERHYYGLAAGGLGAGRRMGPRQYP